MKHASYYDTVSKSGFLAFAKALGDAFGVNVPVVGPGMVLPPELAAGRLEFYEVNPTFAIGLADCTFHKEVRLKQEAVVGADHHRILINIADQPWHLTDHDGISIQCGSSLADAVLFTSNSMETTAHFTPGHQLKAVVLHFHRSWTVQSMLNNPLPVRINSLRQFANQKPMQFTARLDLRSQELANEMLQIRTPERIRVRLLEGYAYQLMALFFNNMVESHTAGSRRFISEDAMRVLQLKEQIEQWLDEPLMPLEKAAETCLMSRTKFINIFRTLFQKNYAGFFHDLKMGKAKALLESGLSITDVGYNLGYANISHFIKAFRLHHGSTPGAWQRQHTAT